MSDNRAYEILLAISEKGLGDISRFNEWVTLQMRKWLAKADPERLKHDLALADQFEDLLELELLKQTLAVKDIAVRDGGFSEVHGPALANAAGALYDHCGWDDESIAVWFGDLVLSDDGVHLGLDLELTDEEEEDQE